jgi:hypothetical protein
VLHGQDQRGARAAELRCCCHSPTRTNAGVGTAAARIVEQLQDIKQNAAEFDTGELQQQQQMMPPLARGLNAQPLPPSLLQSCTSVMAVR